MSRPFNGFYEQILVTNFTIEGSSGGTASPVGIADGTVSETNKQNCCKQRQLVYSRTAATVNIDN